MRKRNHLSIEHQICANVCKKRSPLPCDNQLHLHNIRITLLMIYVIHERKQYRLPTSIRAYHFDFHRFPFVYGIGWWCKCQCINVIDTPQHITQLYRLYSTKCYCCESVWRTHHVWEVIWRIQIEFLDINMTKNESNAFHANRASHNVHTTGHTYAQQQ